MVFVISNGFTSKGPGSRKQFAALAKAVWLIVAAAGRHTKVIQAC
jgi:hypothetical protein